MLRSWKHGRAFLWLLALVGAPGVQPQSNGSGREGPLPFKETLQYSIEWRLITAGKARLTWGPAPETDSSGRTGWQTNLHLESAGLVSKLFKVNDEYVSRVDQDLCAQSSFLTAHEGSRQRETRIVFDRNRKKASYVERDVLKNKLILAQEIDTAPCEHDIAGSIYYMRTLELDAGQAAQIPLSDGKKSAMVRVVAERRETVKTPAGTFKTMRYEAFLFNNVIYRRPARVYIWLTDDRRRLPVRIQVRLQIHIGTITLQLEKEETQ